MIKKVTLLTIGVGIAFFVNHVYSTSSVDDIFFRLSVTVLAGLYAGLLFLIFVLPMLSEGIARLLYSDPGIDTQDVEDPMREARSLSAKGNYVGALEALRQVVMKDSSNRLAWLEMSKIQAEHLSDAEGAAGTLEEALKAAEWEAEDEAVLMFRLAEARLDDLEDRVGSVEILKQICEKFPESKYSANATHQLRELGEL